MMTKTTLGSILMATLFAVAGCAIESDDATLGEETVEQDSNVHLKGGPRAKPSFVDHGLTLGASGDLSGLGNADIVVTLNAMAKPIASCTNPAGQTQPPGQNPAPVAVTGSVAIPASEIKNGTVHFTVATTAPATPIAGAPDCPNPNWTEAITDMKFSSATIAIEQPVGTIVLSVACTFTPETRNGAVAASQVTCTAQ